ncbi:PEP-utilizing enzyme, partial [bacterium]|nr:PEP-utilizing enzyme [bacterium]
KLLPRRIIIDDAGNLDFDETKSSEINFKVTSHGKTRAEAVVMPTIDLDKNIRGKILVTNATDPGWTVLFPLLKGVIIQVGGMLSHASIIAREIGIPCVVVPDAMQVIKSGQVLEIDTRNNKFEISDE